MEHLTADGGSSPEALAESSMSAPELDRALAGAIRRLIAQAGEREPVPGPAI